MTASVSEVFSKSAAYFIRPKMGMFDRICRRKSVVSRRGESSTPAADGTHILRFARLLVVYFHPVVSSFFSPNVSRRRLDVY